MTIGFGFFDANGVWQVGESDPTGPLASDFLNVPLQSISKLFNRTTAYKTSALAINALTAVTNFDITVRNTLPGAWSAAAGTFTFTVAGTYKVTASASYAANATNTTSRAVYIQKAPAASPLAFVSTPGGIGYTLSSASTLNTSQTVIDYVVFAVGDVLRIAASSGTALNLTGANLQIQNA
jgi:hypothetical protein